MLLPAQPPRAALLILLSHPARLAVLLALCGACTTCSGTAPPPAAPAGFDSQLARLDAAPCPPAVDPSLFAQLKAELRRVLLTRTADKAAVAVPATDLSAAAITYSGGNLVWYYFSQGDYDQNGEVNIADLTPLGVHYGTAGPYDWRDAISCVDGDNNGELNIADVTPIGLNFGNRLDGYRIYESSSPADYPDDNLAPNGAGAVLALDVAFAAGTMQPGKRRQFSIAYTAPETSDCLWARPYLGGAEGTASNLYSPGGYWHIYTAATGEAGAHTGFGCSLAVIGGRPAIAFLSDDRPCYVRAADDLGAAWGTMVDVTSDSGVTASMLALAPIDGLPGIAYMDTHYNCIAYTQAADAAGSDWAAPAVVTDGHAERTVALAEVNLRAAVVYDEEKPVPGPTNAYYKRASDNVGSTWPVAAVEIDGVFWGEYPDLCVVAGMPGAVFNESASGLWYAAATDINGTAWAAPCKIQGLNNVMNAGLRPYLGVVADQPAVCYQVLGSPLDGNYPCYARANDSAGSVWLMPAPLKLDSHPNPESGAYSSLVGIDGGVYIAYYDTANTQLRCQHATDFGTLWEAEEIIDAGAGNNVGRCCSMAAVAGHPAVAYYDADAQSLKYAVLH